MPYRFNGKELDPETGNQYYGARYYDPKVSIWLSVDPMSSERSWLTPYNFVQNNPVHRSDPTGLLDICETCPDDQKYDIFRNSKLDWEYNGDELGTVSRVKENTGEDVNVNDGQSSGDNTGFIRSSNGEVSAWVLNNLTPLGAIDDAIATFYDDESTTNDKVNAVAGVVLAGTGGKS